MFFPSKLEQGGGGSHATDSPRQGLPRRNRDATIPETHTSPAAAPASVLEVARRC